MESADIIQKSLASRVSFEPSFLSISHVDILGSEHEHKINKINNTFFIQIEGNESLNTPTPLIYFISIVTSLSI